MADEFASLFRLRVQYVKRGRLRYLSHLEILRACERVVMRAGLPFALSQGFSPRMRIAFGPALPVGVSSDDEWFDLVMTELVSSADALGLLRGAAVDDLMPQRASYVGMREPSLSAALTIAQWSCEVFACDEFGARVPSPTELAPAIGAAFDEVLSAGEIRYLRNGKDKVVSLENKVARAPEVTSGASDGSARVSFSTRSSNEGALRPDVLMRAVMDRCESIPTAGRDGGTARMGAVVSSSGIRLRASINRDAQQIESEDGTWHRPI